MTDTNTLLMMVLKQHFKTRPEVLDEALKVIKDYSNKLFNQKEYHKTINILLEMMNDLPPIILHYFLTMVPLPKQHENESTHLSEVMKDFHITESKDVNTVLLEYLKDMDMINSKNNIHVTPEKSKCTHLKDPDFMIPNKKAKIAKPKGKSKDKCTKSDDLNCECKKLLDICAEYVITNQNFLEKYYKVRKEKVWNIVNSNSCDGDDLLKCYELIKDLNKKAKWIRSLDDEDTLHEVITEQYKDSDVFLKELHLFTKEEEDPFVLSEKLENAIENFCSI